MEKATMKVTAHARQRFRERWPRVMHGVARATAEPLDWTDHDVDAKIRRLLSRAELESVPPALVVQRMLNHMTERGDIESVEYYVNSGARIRFVVGVDSRRQGETVITVEIAGDLRYLNNAEVSGGAA